MFIIGTAVFVLYIVGYLFMVKRQNELQQQQIRFRDSQTRKVNTANFNSYTIDSSILRLRAKRRLTKKSNRAGESADLHCEYSGLPSPNAYQLDTKKQKYA